MTATTARRPRTTKPAEQVRADLLGAAAKLAATKGFSAVAIADIAAEAGVATGTFYRYFPSKDDVLIQLRCAALDDLLGRANVRSVPGDERGWWTTATAVIESTVRFWFDDRDRALVVLRGGFTDDGVRIQSEIADRFAAGIEFGQQIGAVSAEVDARTAAGFLLHGAFGLIYHAIVNGDPDDDPETLVAALTTIARRMLVDRERPRQDSNLRPAD